MGENDFLQHVLPARDYREFLKRALEYYQRSKRNFSYAEFSRRAGFSSRSHPRDVEMGYRRLTAQSLPRFIRGLGLKGDLKRYFILLASRDEPELNSSKFSLEQIEQKLLRFRRRLEMKFQPRMEVPQVFALDHWAEIYAALGSLERGASFEDILSRTHLDRNECAAQVEQLSSLGLAKFDPGSQRYFPGVLHLALDQQGKEELFKTYYIESLAKLAQSPRKNFESSDRLFFSSAFSINKEKMALLRNELREVLLRFVVSSEDQDGNEIVKLIVGFTGPK
jgi:hypothetical protein